MGNVHSVLLSPQHHQPLHPSPLRSLRVAGPIGVVLPVDPLVPQHERVEVVAGLQDGQGAPQLAVPDNIPHAVPALEDLGILEPDPQADLV